MHLEYLLAMNLEKVIERFKLLVYLRKGWNFENSLANQCRNLRELPLVICRNYFLYIQKEDIEEKKGFDRIQEEDM